MTLFELTVPSEVERRLSVLQWMVGTTITLQLITLTGMLGLLWRLVPAS